MDTLLTVVFKMISTGKVIRWVKYGFKFGQPFKENLDLVTYNCTVNVLNFDWPNSGTDLKLAVIVHLL